MLTVMYVCLRRDPFKRPRCALTVPDTAFCPHNKSYQIYRFSLSPSCPDASIHFRTDTQKPASILSPRTLTAGRTIVIAIQCQQPSIQQRVTRPWPNAVYFTDGRNSTKLSTATDICEATPYSLVCRQTKQGNYEMPKQGKDGGRGWGCRYTIRGSSPGRVKELLFSKQPRTVLGGGGNPPYF